MELAHRAVVRDGKRDVDVLARRAAHERERTRARRDVEPLCLFVRDAKPQDRSDRVVETFRRIEVGDAYPEVVDDVLALARAAVVHSLGAIAIRVDEEGPVVVLVISGRGPGMPSLA
jgi:hypothetical protein